MAEEDLLDNLDDGGDAAPAPKKKKKLKADGGAVAAFVPSIVTIVVLTVVVLMFSGGKQGNPEFEKKLGAAVDALAKNQEKIIAKLNDPGEKIQGVKVPTFYNPLGNDQYYLSKNPITLNVGAKNFAKTRVIVVVEKEIAHEMEAAKGGGGKDSHGGGGDGHGGGGAAAHSFGDAPEWFTEYSPWIAEVLQSFFQQIQYANGGYVVEVEGGVTTKPLTEVQKILVAQLNAQLAASDTKLRIAGIFFPEFIIQ